MVCLGNLLLLFLFTFFQVIVIAIITPRSLIFRDLGALIDKSNEDSARSWELREQISIDTTDSSSINISISTKGRDLIIVEPSFNNSKYNAWLSNKCWAFFNDLIKKPVESEFCNDLLKLNQFKNVDIGTFIWKELWDMVSYYVYLSRININFIFNQSPLVIVFENLSLEILSLLLVNNFNNIVSIRRSDKQVNIKNSIECNFQLSLLWRILLNNYKNDDSDMTKYERRLT